eukprot:CAMPEP_0198142730 /NCGR_PEP_ID=MMETSP1443-20131203/5442_1 /TAXON_ID=186043 /ORGANISM="Entomoneis sp., Strain CCMP2396" /LENGTH=649 /DNA_ID=CAMNT_0043805811 /DNA_START=139 /DNA_END=2088 /DNA_ORIENTATION=+
MVEENVEIEHTAEDPSSMKEEKQENDKAAPLDRGQTPSVQRLDSASSLGMESSVLKFKDCNFIVGGKDNKKNILTDVNGVVKFGRVLAIMGPSGAGKTTLISALTLDAHYGVATGSVKLNGIPLTQDIFREHCYVVKQHDKHWPYLTCRETLIYATQLYAVVAKNAETALVDEVIAKMGLLSCADTTNARLSGGQRRRLSIGVALVKQPRVLFLDEPTSGLDAASSQQIMQEIVRVAKEERLVTICTIHQPSTKVYESFDQVMIMSRGRTAFVGEVGEAVSYFEGIGYPMPDDTNPAEFFLDLVNSDFSDEAEVTKILDSWEEKVSGATSSHHVANDEDKEGTVNLDKKPILPEIMILFSRHFKLIRRDPILYIGRAIMFLVSCLIFSLVYLSARDDNQDQVINKFWIIIWVIAVPSQLGVVAVYTLNDEFKSLLRETKNGMLSGVSYVIAKSILVTPIMYIFSLFSLGIPFFAVIGASGASFVGCTLIYAACLFCFESVAECLSVWFEDPILGMLMYMNFWFGSFLFGGFLIPQDDMYYPFEIFYYVMPFSYYARSFAYNYFKHINFEACDPDITTTNAVCVDSDQADGTTSGIAVLVAFAKVFPLLSSTDETAKDIGITIAVGMFFKLCYIMGILIKTSQASKFVKA